jgi:two-component system phosphate regulon sensor histidine kinase PhoR
MVAERYQTTTVRTDQQSLDYFLAATFRHPARIAILHAIDSQPGGVSYKGLTELLAPVTAETIARHLRILRKVGAIVPHVGANVSSVTYLLADTPNTRVLRAMLAVAEAREHEYFWPALELLKTVIAAVPEAVVLVGVNGEFLLVNDAAEKLLSRHPTRESIFLQEYAVTFPFYTPGGDRLAMEDMPILRALAGDTVIGEQVVYLRPDGTRLDLLYNAAPIMTTTKTGRHVTAAVCTFQDISRLKALERQRDEFLSIAAHELRTPLTSILGTVQVLSRQLRRATDEKPLDLANLKRGLDRVNDQSQRINKLVSDLLDTSRIQAGHLEFSMGLVDLKVLVDETVDGQSLAHPGRQIMLLTPEWPIPVIGDAVRLAQVFDNLLTNALKYSTEDAPVEVEISVDDNEACVRVQDHGDGIPPEALPHIFERFYRVPGMEVKSDSGVGLGLGLYITYTIVARHNGRIEVTAEPRAGTTFRVYIPVYVSPTK